MLFFFFFFLYLGPGSQSPETTYMKGINSFLLENRIKHSVYPKNANTSYPGIKSRFRVCTLVTTLLSMTVISCVHQT